MQKPSFLWAVPFSLTLFTACHSTNPKDATASTSPLSAQVTEESYREYVTALAADDLEGRKPFTNGEKKTLAYLEREAKALGLEPGNGNSYLQEVPMVEITSAPAPTMQVKGKQSFELKGLEEYVVWAKRPEVNSTIQESELVFAGFGIVAPEYNWNDYAGLDVKDKVAVVLVSDPGFYSADPTFFKGRTMTYYGRWTYKLEEAARQGAKGCLIVHATEPAGYGFQVVQNNWNASRFYLDNRNKPTYKCAMEGWVTTPVAERLFSAAGKNFQAELQRAAKPGFKGMPLGLTVSTSIQAKVKYDKSYNFIAKISGSKRPDEAIVYSAHWDHLGIGKKNAQNDSIYNGAADNASGTAGLLAVAKAFKALPQKPERSIVFLSVTAEEQGLLGSAHYAENPVFAKEKTVANLNIDMLNPYGATKDMVLIGQGQSELEEILAEEAKKAGRYLAPDPTPEAGLYYRSDHFNFAKTGVPALFTGMGTDHVQLGPAEGKKLLANFTANIYHKQNDEVNAAFKFDGAVADLQLLYQMGKRLAFSNQWPQWKPGSEFKAVREKYMKR
ncbi:M28 family metallopeptidase [Rufibacter quisquiliarum]|uniref:Zn-dependent M28 family amino/carboxypeptidase n=1 Tax=Rufibacter quisquiliarum TaxID=1549639 RepID=A0A839GGJ6_9BACT|nr:M28 family metallopeptidase [Rufibacter quisquiliarum]MBA9076713.1 Zn-dependent M28 family amino/carboxypeptidase [Rufibacter quisquiliarum]